MKKSVRFQTSIIILSSLMFFSACSQHGYSNEASMRPLVPTVEPTTEPENKAPDKNAPPKKIRVGQDEVILGKIKLNKAQGGYDKSSLLISVDAEITLDGVTEETFLEGKVHSSGFANLYPKTKGTGKLDKTSGLKVRGRATCLKYLKQNKFSCESAVIDIYVLYKGTVYSEQMKLTEEVSVSIEHGTQAPDQSPPPIDSTLPGEPEVNPENPPSEPSTPVTPQPQEESVPEDNSDEENSDIADKNDENEEAPQEDQEVPSEKQPEQNADTKTEQDKKHDHEKDEKKGRYVGPILEGFRELFERTEDKSQDHPVPSLDPKKANRPTDQAIEFVNSGKLKNASSFVAENSENEFIGILVPSIERYYGTWDLVEMMKHLSQVTKQSLPDYKLYMKDASKKNGGFLGTSRKSGHKSHQNGLDIDVAYLVSTPQRQSRFTNIVENGRLAKDVYIEETWKVFKAALSHPMGEIIFTNAPLKKALCAFAKKEKDPKSIQVLKRIRVEKGHQNHFHLRLKCGDFNPRCQDIDYRDYEVGC